jgi:hypothetical protein
MGCVASRDDQSEGSSYIEAPTKKFNKPKWRSRAAMTASELEVLLARGPGLFSPSCRPASRAGSQESAHPAALTLLSTAMVRLCPQRKREEFWETQPHYGGDKGQHTGCRARRGWMCSRHAGAAARAWLARSQVPQLAPRPTPLQPPPARSHLGRPQGGHGRRHRHGAAHHRERRHRGGPARHDALLRRAGWAVRAAKVRVDSAHEPDSRRLM